MTQISARRAFKLLHRCARRLNGYAEALRDPYNGAHDLTDSALRELTELWDADYREFLDDRKNNGNARGSVFDAVLWALHGTRIGTRDPRTPKWASEMKIAFSLGPDESRVWWVRPKLP